MLGRLKKVLGIEGVKLELLLDDPTNVNEQKVSGILKFTTKSKGTVDGITVKVIEKYIRGRRKTKLIDEYPIGILTISEKFTIEPEEIIELPFDMVYERVLSEMDKIEKSSFFAMPFIKLAKKIKGVKSSYYVIAEANVKGTTLNPFDRKDL
ncbi:MAG: sporulation protein [Saprospiraceae bacterium]